MEENYATKNTIRNLEVEVKRNEFELSTNVQNTVPVLSVQIRNWSFQLR